MWLDLPEAKISQKSTTNFYMIATLCEMPPKVRKKEKTQRKTQNYIQNYLEFLPKAQKLDLKVKEIDIKAKKLDLKTQKLD